MTLYRGGTRHAYRRGEALNVEGRGRACCRSFTLDEVRRIQGMIRVPRELLIIRAVHYNELKQCYCIHTLQSRPLTWLSHRHHFLLRRI